MPTKTNGGFAELTGSEKPKFAFNVDLYVGKNIVSSIQVMAEDKVSAVQIAVRQTRTRVTKAKQPTKDTTNARLHKAQKD